MNIRITQQTLSDQSIRNAQLRSARIADLQTQLASGLRISKPSDDPSAIGSLLANKATDARMEVDLENIASAQLKLNQSVSQLLEASLVFTRAREIALSAAQSQERETLAQEVDALIDRLLTIANGREGGLQLFSGTATEHVAFEVVGTDENGRPLQVQYLGSTGRSQVVVAPNTAIDTIYSGAEIFQQRNRQTSVYSGTTGAAAGIGTDSTRGSGELLVRHTSTSYGGGIGVNPGASSAAGDTIIGAAGTHRLTIENHPQLGRVVRLNGGGPVPFDNTSVDLPVHGPQGEVVYVDLSGVAPGLTADVSILSAGTVSVDGGLTEVAIDFSANQTLTHSQTGEVTHVDSAMIHRTGVDRIEYVGTADAFEALINLRDQLRSTEQLPTAELDKMLSFRIAGLRASSKSDLASCW